MKKLKNVADIYPLTPTQLGMLYHTLREPEAGHYFEQVRCDLLGNLNLEWLQQAWRHVIAAHPPLRSIFLWEGVDNPLQIVRQNVDVPWQILDWRKKDVDEQKEGLDDLCQSFRQSGFVLDKAPLLNFAAVRLTDQKTHFVWNFHHMLLDGWSTAIVIDEAFTAYEALAAGQPPAATARPPFRSYLSWLKKQDADQAKHYWQGQIGDVSAPTPLQVDKKAPPGRFSLGRQAVSLSVETSARLKSIAQQNRITMNTVIQGAWGMLLNRYSGQDDVIFGVTTSGRPADLPRVEEIVGMFLSTMPMRLNLAADRPIINWLQEVQTHQLEINQFQYSSLSDIQRWSQIPAGKPLFESLLIFENYPGVQGQDERQLKMVNKTVSEQSNYPLTFLIGLDERLELLALYNQYRFDAAVIDRLLGHLCQILSQIAANPDQKVHELEMLSPLERKQIVVEWNQTDAAYPDNTSIPALFDAQAAAAPDKTALIFNDQTMSYRQLAERSNQLAHALIKMGVGPEIPVGVSLNRSFDMIVSLLGIVKAGGAYVPMDPNYPKERLQIIMEDVQMPVVITETAVESSLPAVGLPVILIDEFEYAAYPVEAPPITCGPDSSLFITFTSGSTGRPKGVQGHHRGVLNRCQWQWEMYPLGEDEVCCQKTTLNFVDHLWEVWGPLLKGTPAVLIPDEEVKDGDRFLTVLAEHQIERMVLVPSFMRVLLDTYPDLAEKLPKLKYWTLSGEPISRALADLFRERLPHAIMLNFYGMSEATIDATSYDDRWNVECQTIPIGKPINNLKVYVLDKLMRLVPVGVPGEIYVGGVGLSRGYWGRDDLTAERFFPNPFVEDPAARIYKSGDLGRWLPEGHLDYIGRADHQVKIRGFRVEPGEIEAAIRKHPAVNDAIVVAQDYGEDKRLIAYVIAGENIGQEEIKDVTRTRLPDYMVPAGVLFLEAFPLTPNGKVNRLALPKPEFTRARRNDKPLTATEAQMISLWENIIGIEGIGPDDDFFDIGGHSLLALRLFSRLKKEFNVNLPLAELVEAPTPRKLSALIDPEAADEKEANRQWVHLVPFGAPLAPHQTLFCVHGAGGNVINFRDLAQALQTEWHLVGIQASGVDGVSPLLKTLDEMTDSYVAELKAYQPHGPYALSGFSSGGIIALEMAQRLKAAGEEVSALIFFDTFHPGQRPRRRSMKDYMQELIDGGPNYVIELFKDRNERRMVQEEAVLKAEKAQAAGDIVPFELRDSQLVHNILTALKGYEPQMYSGRIIQIAAKDVWWMYDHIPPHRGWTDLMPQLEVIEVDGDHNTLVLPPHVSTLADGLRQLLRQPLRS